jgi:hypothetical protein
MIREEQIGCCRLILGDSRDIINDLSADVIITDPVWPNCPPDTIKGSDDPDGLWQATCKAMPDVARLIVVMRGDSDPRFLRHGPWSQGDTRARAGCAAGRPPTERTSDVARPSSLRLADPMGYGRGRDSS